MSTAPVAPMTREQIDAILNQWHDAKQKLDAAKDAEMALRQIIVKQSGMFDAAKVEGTQTYQLGGGWSIKAVKKQNYKIENKKGEAFAVLHQLEIMTHLPTGEINQDLLNTVKELFSFDANLRKTQFDKLRGPEKKLVEDILTITDGAPSLELIPPKDVA